MFLILLFKYKLYHFNMRKFIAYIIFSIFIFSYSCVNAQEKFIHKIQPDHIKIQFAGNIGVFSTGIGYSFFSNKIQSDLLYGLVPASIGGEDIHTIANKNTFKIFQHSIVKNLSLIHSIGFSLNYSITNNTFLSLPEYYPDGYYAINAIRFAPLFSCNFIYINENFKLFNNINIYFEISTLDNYLWYYIKETEAIGFSDIWNLAIGINYLLK